MRHVMAGLLACLTINFILAGDCIVPGSYTLVESGAGPYSYLYTIDLDTLSGNDTKAIQITFTLSGGSTTTVCYPPPLSNPITHNFFNESVSGQTGNLSYISYTANNGSCQGGTCSSGSLDNFLLPIRLVDFNLQEQDGAVMVNWITTSEINHDYYEVERSINLIDFETVEVLTSVGLANAESRYEVIDLTAPMGHVYYRLKSVDLDGTFQYSAVGSVVVTQKTELELFPNPTRGYVYLRNAALLEIAGPIYLIDGGGQRILVDMEINGDRATIDLNRFEPGLYILQTPLRSFRIVRL
ncbi:MAG: hypothetical protein OEQ53_10755 [Saprospiraceae bacterium]|nr:hypothetical protein [Saprospiraceae bacterium]